MTKPTPQKTLLEEIDSRVQKARRLRGTSAKVVDAVVGKIKAATRAAKQPERVAYAIEGASVVRAMVGTFPADARTFAKDRGADLSRRTVMRRAAFCGPPPGVTSATNMVGIAARIEPTTGM